LSASIYHLKVQIEPISVQYHIVKYFKNYYKAKLVLSKEYLILIATV
jgi:hypothetical protein